MAVASVVALTATAGGAASGSSFWDIYGTGHIQQLAQQARARRGAWLAGGAWAQRAVVKVVSRADARMRSSMFTCQPDRLRRPPRPKRHRRTHTHTHSRTHYRPPGLPVAA